MNDIFEKLAMMTNPRNLLIMSSVNDNDSINSEIQKTEIENIDKREFFIKNEIEILQGLSDCIANLNKSVKNMQISINTIKLAIYTPCLNSGISDEILHREAKQAEEWQKQQNDSEPIAR